MPTNDNDVPGKKLAPPPLDAHGQAALLLVESLIHGLCEEAVLGIGKAVEIADRAVEVQEELAEAADGAAAPMWRSHALLRSIATSLKTDGGQDFTSPV